MDEDAPVTGYIYTHADCPNCGEAGDYEGDRSHEEVRCTACGETFKIGGVL